MPRTRLPIVALAVCASLARAADPTPPQAAADACARSNAMAYTGLDGWLFLGKELRHLASTNIPTQAVDTIADFKAQLDRIGVELLVVPVPCKATVYPDKLGLAGEMPTPDRTTVEALRARGLEVVDLVEDFRQARAAGQDPYCHTDTHWSPAGIALAAKKIAGIIAARPWASSLPKTPFGSSEGELAIKGDLGGDAERLRARTVTPTPATSRTSPVLLLGDSHNLVFSAGGDMHASSAGLPDLLALELQSPADVVAVLGSGATPARRNLARRKDSLSGKKIVVWCFSAREFTQSDWDKVQVTK